MSETQLSASIRGALEANGFWVIRQQSKGRTGRRSVGSGEPGIPDLQILGMGRGWLEVKTEDGELSPVQIVWHAKAVAAGERIDTVRNIHEALVRALAWRREDERQPT